MTANLADPATCVLDFSTPVRSGMGDGILPDGKVDACAVQRSWLLSLCRSHPGATLEELRELVDAEPGRRVPDDHPSISRVIRRFTTIINDGLPDGPRQRIPWDRILGTVTTDADEERRAWLC